MITNTHLGGNRHVRKAPQVLERLLEKWGVAAAHPGDIDTGGRCIGEHTAVRTVIICFDVRVVLSFKSLIMCA